MPSKTLRDGTQYWNLPGPVENWGTGIERKVWGMKPHFAQTWERLAPQDVLFFYVTAPVGGVVGHGRVVTKFKGESPLWPDEITARQVIYPYRFEFEVTRALEAQRWMRDRISVGDLKMAIRAIGRVPPDTAARLLTRIKEKWGAAPVAAPIPADRPRSRHDQTKELLVEIGRLREFVCSKEYRMDGERLDVVWKRVEHGVPTYAFEVQVGGNIYQAIAKLKHAFDIWNSKIRLVIDAESVPRVKDLLRGTFHEIATELRVVELEKLEHLERALATVHDLEKELGLSY